MSTIQKWLGGMIALGAGFLVLTNPAGVYALAQGGRTLIGGTETDIITGGKK